MKKLLLLVVVALLFVGCDGEKAPSVRGRKYINDNEYVEMLYEWDMEVPDKITIETTMVLILIIISIISIKI